MTFASTFGRTFSPTFQPSSQAAAAAGGWWLSGGIAAANCIAAYQAKGAASYAASLVNLTGNATYDAYKGQLYAPTWDTATGWDFSDHDQSNGLATSIYPTSGNKYSVIVRFTDGRTDNYGILVGARTGSNSIRVFNSMNVDDHAYYINGTGYSTSARLTSGVMCNASGKGYLDGTYEVGSEAALATDLCMFSINGQNYQTSGTTGFTVYNSFMGKIQAIAFYDIALSPTQVSALTTAMNAL